MSAASDPGAETAGHPATHRMRRGRGLRAIALAASAALLGAGAQANAQEPTEYRLKTAFIYNFMAFTEWPADAGPTLNLCIHGPDPFGAELDALQGKTVLTRTIGLQRKVGMDALKNCQAVFVTREAQDQLPKVLETLRGQPVLTIADSPGAMRRGVALNMNLAAGKVTFEANAQAARSHGITLSSKLLRLATEVQP